MNDLPPTQPQSPSAAVLFSSATETFLRLKAIYAFQIAVAASILIFILAYAFTGWISRGQGRYYDQLTSAWAVKSTSLTELGQESHRISSATNDPDIKFVADYFGTSVDVNAEVGYHTLDDMVHAGMFENFARGAITGWFSPQLNFKSIPLMWNKTECQRRSKIIDSRYGGWRFWPIWWGTVAGFFTFYAVQGKSPFEN